MHVGKNKVSLSSYAYVRQKEVLTFQKILIQLKLKKKIIKKIIQFYYFISLAMQYIKLNHKMIIYTSQYRSTGSYGLLSYNKKGN